jgi:hypothetical protein
MTEPAEYERGLTALELLGSISNGKLLEDLHLALVLISEEVTATRNPGSVILKLNVSPAQGSDVALVISDQIERKPPKNQARETMFFSVGDGQLRKSDPRQQRFELRTIDGGGAEFRVTEVQETAMREVGS